MDLVRVFEKGLKSKKLVGRGDHILLAVSGGVDSMVLLDCFHRVEKKFGLALGVVHLNHGLRGAESDQDEEFVAQLVREKGYSIYVKRVDVGAYCRENRLSWQDGAHRLRRAFFMEVLRKEGYHKLATGHHADDQAETILIHLLKGTGLQGLKGMAFCDPPLIRPLLGLSRDEIIRYANQRGLVFREDSSNRERKYLRNRIRLDLFPFLKSQFNPQVIEALNRTAIVLNECQQLVDHYAQRAWDKTVRSVKKNEIILDNNKFLHYFNILKFQILTRAYIHVHGQPNGPSFLQCEGIFRLSEQGGTGQTISLGGGVRVLKNRDELVVFKKSTPFFPQDVVMGEKKSFLGGKFSFLAEPVARGEVHFDGNPWVEYVDADRVHPPLWLRGWRPGDRFVPLGFKVSKKLSDFFVNSKVSLSQKDRIPLLESRGRIVWVCGHRLSEEFKITEETQRVLRLKLEIRT